MVSRRHARIIVRGPNIVIEDLKSTNGTYVNGEKIHRARLLKDDRVLIGTSIMKVVPLQQAKTSEAQARRDMAMVAEHRRTSQVKSMSGSIDEIPLPDLLQLLGTSKKSGVLVVQYNEGVGKIFLRDGIIYYATINDLDELTPMKAVFRMLSWTQGTFDLEPADSRDFEDSIQMSVQSVIMEGLRQMDEFNQIRGELPKLGARLQVRLPLEAALRDLSPTELDIVQLVHNYGYFEQVLNRSPQSDLDTSKTILKLLKDNYFEVEGHISS
jgi:hypothetical protein